MFKFGCFKQDHVKLSNNLTRGRLVLSNLYNFIGLQDSSKLCNFPALGEVFRRFGERLEEIAQPLSIDFLPTAHFQITDERVSASPSFIENRFTTQSSSILAYTTCAIFMTVLNWRSDYYFNTIHVVPLYKKIFYFRLLFFCRLYKSYLPTYINLFCWTFKQQQRIYK